MKRCRGDWGAGEGGLRGSGWRAEIVVDIPAGRPPSPIPRLPLLALTTPKTGPKPLNTNLGRNSVTTTKMTSTTMMRRRKDSSTGVRVISMYMAVVGSGLSFLFWGLMSLFVEISRDQR